MACPAKETTRFAVRVPFNAVDGMLFICIFDLNLVHRLCFHRGPGFRTSDFESCRIIAEKQFLGAQTVMNGALNSVTGPVKSVHTYMTM